MPPQDCVFKASTTSGFNMETVFELEAANCYSPQATETKPEKLKYSWYLFNNE